MKFNEKWWDKIGQHLFHGVMLGVLIAVITLAAIKFVTTYAMALIFAFLVYLVFISSNIGKNSSDLSGTVKQGFFNWLNP